MAIDPNSIVWDAPVAAPAMGGGMIPTVSPAAATASAQSLREQQANAFGGGAGILWDGEVQGPPRADFSNVQAGVTRTAMTPLQASGEVPLPSDWQGQRPPARAATLPNFRDFIDSVDPFAAITESAPARNLVDNVRKSKFGRGAAERFHRANAFATKLEAVPGIIWDSASSAITGEPTTAAQDFFFRAAESSERAADENALRPGAGFFETLAHGAGGLAVDLPIMVATEGGGAVAPAAETIAPSATRIVGNALLRSARVSSIPASVNATDTAQRVLDRGGSGEEALRAGLGSAASDVVATAVPLGVEGGTFRRLISGAGAGGAAAAAGSQIRNAALPEDMRVQPEAGELGVGAVQGAALGALLGPRASRSGRDVRPRNAATDVFDRAAQRAAGEGAEAPPPDRTRVAARATADDLTRYAADRLAALDRKATGTPDQTITGDDGKPTTVPGKGGEYLTDAEKEERDFLRAHANNPEALAELMGVTLEPSRQSDWRAELAEHPDVPDDVRTAIADRYEAAEKTLPKFDADVRDIADSVGGRAIVAPLKGVTRTVDKVVADYGGDTSQIKDLVRGTIEMPSHEDADAVLSKLREKYGEPIKLKNSLDPNQPPPFANGYRGINSVWSIDGEPVELQVNLPEMLEAKEKAHPFYEEWQAIGRKADKEGRDLTQEEKVRQAELDAEQAAIYQPAWEAAMRRINSSREITSASSRKSEPDNRSPSGQVRQTYPSSDASLPPGITPNTARGPNSGSEAGRGASTAAIAFTSGESVPQRGSEWVPFDKDSGTLGILRSEMPQIKAKDRDDFVRYLASRGIEGESTRVPADSLKPTQAEFSPARAARFAKSGPMDGSRAVLVSSDGYILDGHHQWLAHQQAGTDVPVLRLNAPIRELLKVAGEFPAVRRSEGADGRPPLKVRAGGRRAEAFTASNEAIPFRYALVDADDLIASNFPDGRVNPAYPQELQPRDRTSAESRTQVQQIAGNLQPERLGESPDIVNGAPLVGPDGVVESGNGRVMALASAPVERRNAYRRWLRANADRFGIDPKAVDDVRDPVLVRVREGDLSMEERARLGQEGNRGTQQAMNPTEIARSDARLIDDEMMALFQPSEDGDVLGPSNQAFLREFARRIGGMEAAGLSSEGRWTKQMADRVNAAVFWRAYGDERLLHAFAAEADPDMKGILSALSAGAREFALARSNGAREAGLDAGALFADAMALLRDARDRGMSMRGLLSQGDMFGSGPDPSVARMATWLSDNARAYRRLGESLVEMGRSIRAELEGRSSGDMFGRQDRGLQEIADETVRQHESRNRPPAQSGLFTAGGKPRPADAGGDRAREPHGLGRAPADAVPHRVKGAGRDGSAETASDAGLARTGSPESLGSKRRAKAGRRDKGKAEGPRRGTRRKLPREDDSSAGPSQVRESTVDLGRIEEGPATTYSETTPIKGSARDGVADGAHQLDLFASPIIGRIPLARRIAKANLLQRTELVTTGSFRSGVERITSWRDAAHIIAPLRKSPQEQMLAIVADKDMRPLAVIRHSIGTIKTSLVSPGTLFGAVAQVPGAAHVWLAHNHPSGNIHQSEADLFITNRMTQLMRGSGIESHGMIVVGPGRREASLFESVDEGHQTRDTITAAPRSVVEVPMRERALRRIPTGERAPIIDHHAAVEYVRKNPGTGVLFLDLRNKPVGFLPMDASEMARLRTGDPETGSALIARSAAEANAARAIIVTEGNLKAAQNVGRMLSDARLDPFDIIDTSGDEPTSIADVGRDTTYSASDFLSGARGSGQSVESLRESLHQSSLGTALRALERTGVLRLIDDPGQKFAGRWDGQHAVLNAAHIPVGPDGFAVALHELGIHRERDAGLRGMLGDDVFNGLVKRITEIESTTAPILREAREAIAEARARIEAAGTPTHQRDEELLAYTAEAAARRLAAGSKNGVLRDLLDRIVRRIRAWLVTGPIGKALAARGFALKVTPDDLVAIAQAAVRRQAREAARVEPVPTSAAEARYSQPVTLTPRQERALGKIGVTGRRESPREAFRRITENAGKRLTQGIVDQFAPLKDLDMTGYMQARLSKGTDGALEAAFLHGLPKLTDGALDIDVDGKGLRGILAELEGEHDMFLAWVAGNRAAKLKAEGRENLFTDDDIAALKSLNQGKMANGRLRGVAYAKAQESFRRYQKAVLDIAEEAGLIDGDSRAAWESDFYVPFYRIAEDDAAAFVPGKVGNGLVRQQAFKKLKGGTAELNDLLSNTLANWSHLLTASMRNMAATKALAAAEKLGIAERISEAETGSVWISVKGKQVHYRVEDPLVLDALTALNYTGIKGAGMDAMRWFRHALTMGVTISPTFRIRNLLRDTISVLAVSDDAGYNPLRNIVDGWHGTRAGSATDIKLLAGGGKIRFGSLNDGQQARNAKRLIEMGIEDSQILDTQDKIANALHAAFDWWKEVGDRSETINRAAVYQNAIKAGKSHLEASFEARDLLDFTAGGKWASVRFLTGVVPFLNARIQGIYKLGKAARGNPLRFAAVAGTVALASALNYLLQKDDPDYKALPDWARDTYWCVKLGDKMLFIPKPFEIGAMGSIVERMTELAVSGGDYTAGDFAHTLAAIISDQLSMNPIPQAVKPAMEAAFNYDMFRGRPIDSMGDERLPPGDRVGPTTSAGAVALGRAAGVSPKRIEHLARGYFGWLGTQALNASDWALRDAMDLPSNPRRDLTDINNVFVIGDFLKNARLNSDKYVTRFYAAQEQIDAIYAAHSLARKTGDEARESELAESRELRMRPTYQAANKRISRINQRIKAIANDREMSAREKRIALDELYAERAEIAREADEEARATP